MSSRLTNTLIKYVKKIHEESTDLIRSMLRELEEVLTLLLKQPFTSLQVLISLIDHLVWSPNNERGDSSMLRMSRGVNVPMAPRFGAQRRARCRNQKNEVAF